MLRASILFSLCFSLSFLTPPTAIADVVNVRELVQRENHLAEKIRAKINTPEGQQKLASLGISAEEATARVAGLSDQEIRDLMNTDLTKQAGGDIVIGLTTVLLIIIIILLLR